jgi:pyruvate/2-oxoglutarate/acetoin dehydrogenase E1 component
VSEKAFDYLDAPIKRVAAANTPVPFAPTLENFVIPDERDIIKEVKELFG